MSFTNVHTAEEVLQAVRRNFVNTTADRQTAQAKLSKLWAEGYGTQFGDIDRLIQCEAEEQVWAEAATVMNDAMSARSDAKFAIGELHRHVAQQLVVTDAGRNSNPVKQLMVHAQHSAWLEVFELVEPKARW